MQKLRHTDVKPGHMLGLCDSKTTFILLTMWSGHGGRSFHPLYAVCLCPGSQWLDVPAALGTRLPT